MTTAPDTASQHTTKCEARNRAGNPCQRPAGWGTDHPGIGRCKLHLGSAPNHRKHAQVEQARQAVQRFGLASVGHEVEAIDPRDVLAEELWRTLVTVRGLDVVVGELGREIHGKTFHVSGIATGETRPHWAWLEWQQERKHLAAVAAAAEKAGIEARRVDLLERVASQVAQLLRAIFGDGRLELSSAQYEAALDVSADHLRLLASNPA